MLPGSVYVTVGTARRSTGTHYTPPSLTEPIVQHTLEPLVYEGPAEGLPTRAMEAQVTEGNSRPKGLRHGHGFGRVPWSKRAATWPSGWWKHGRTKRSSIPAKCSSLPRAASPRDCPASASCRRLPAERLAIARRVVADRCLYGVDINPMAVEMAKLSLWLITLDPSALHLPGPRLQVWRFVAGHESLEQLENFSLRPGGGKQRLCSTMNLGGTLTRPGRNARRWKRCRRIHRSRSCLRRALCRGGRAVAKLNAAADMLDDNGAQRAKGQRLRQRA